MRAVHLWTSFSPPTLVSCFVLPISFYDIAVYWSKRSTFTQVYSIIEAEVVIACFIPSRSRLCCCSGYHICFHSFSLSLVRVLPFVILSLGVPWLINIMVGLFQLLYRSIQIRLAVNFYPPSLPEGTRLPGAWVGKDFVFSILLFILHFYLFYDYFSAFIYCFIFWHICFTFISAYYTLHFFLWNTGTGWGVRQSSDCFRQVKLG